MNVYRVCVREVNGVCIKAEYLEQNEDDKDTSNK